jgi:hypothetical protein
VQVGLWPARIAAVVEVQHYDFAAIIVDAIPHAVLTAPSPPQALERRPQRRRHGLRPRQQGPEMNSHAAKAAVDGRV